MNTNQHIIDAAREALDAVYGKDKYGFSDHEKEVMLEFAAIITQPLRQELAFYRKAFKPALEEQLKKQLAETQAQLKEAREALEVTLNWSSYETEYDGRMYTICHSCSGQDGEHRQGCEIKNYENIIKQSKDYSALDAAIEPYRLDAERLDALSKILIKYNLDHCEYGYTFFPKCINGTPIVRAYYKKFKDLVDAAIARKG